MDAFFVSVELLERPELRGKPVVVGGRPDQRGVVSAASYEARKFGIQSAMPLRTAGKLCPQAIFLDGHHARYGEWSDHASPQSWRNFPPVVEMVSIDECISRSGRNRAFATDRLSRRRTRYFERLRLLQDFPARRGLRPRDWSRKLPASRPNQRGLLWVTAGQEPRFSAQLPVRKIPGIGEVTERALRALGIEYVHELADYPQEKLEKIFGQWGTALYRKARGGDWYEFVLDAEPKSISQNHTFGEDTSDVTAMESMLSHLHRRHALIARSGTFFAHVDDYDLATPALTLHTRSKTLHRSCSI